MSESKQKAVEKMFYHMKTLGLFPSDKTYEDYRKHREEREAKELKGVTRKREVLNEVLE